MKVDRETMCVCVRERKEREREGERQKRAKIQCKFENAFPLDFFFLQNDAF